MKRLAFPLLAAAGLIAVISCAELPSMPNILIPTWTQSYQLYRQPHAVWLDQYDAVGENLPSLGKALNAAAKAKQTPEFVVYAIPLRDLGQSSEGGFDNYEDYLADNRLNANLIRKFAEITHITPVVYLEPDSIPLAVQYRRDNNFDTESRAIYDQRIRVTRSLIDIYRDAGARVYLEAGHSGWFDYGEEDVQRIAAALNEAGIAMADGLATNVSNRQPVTGNAERTEAHYLARLLPLLDNKHLDVRVDTSRNGGPTKAREYTLAENGILQDNEQAPWRMVGRWERTPNGETWLRPFFGKAKPLSRLLAKEKYTYDANRRVLTAPPWLDAVGDVKLGPAPTDTPPAAVSSVIQHYRYIKPPDDCDGALNCPPGESKHDINKRTEALQPKSGSITPPNSPW